MSGPEGRPAVLAFQWFGLYGLAYCIPLLVLTVALMDREVLFVALSSCLALAVSYHAWRSARGRVGLTWRIWFGVMMAAGWAIALALVFAPPGETGICYDRLFKNRPWGPVENLGPDPYCKGVPIEAVERS